MHLASGALALQAPLSASIFACFPGEAPYGFASSHALPRITSIRMHTDRHFPENNLRFRYFNEPAFLDAYAEVFGEDVYHFESAHESPYIIDAGANLGLASCYFKNR